ncbi:MAG: phenylalanine--tRNA ligase subunit beta, partial [Chloroflexi bacterium]
GILETLFNRLGLEADFEPAEELGLLPSRTAKVMLDGRQVGVLGDIHPQVKVNFDLVSESISLFEIWLDELVSSVERVRLYRPLPRFPGVARDLALLADEALPAKRIKELIQGFPQVRRVELFDVYQGERIPPGKKSLTFSVLYQSPERTLTDEEVSQLQQQILEKLEKELGVVLRR